MLTLVAILWIVYVSECFVRCRPGCWVFRPGAAGRIEGVPTPDLTFLDGRLAFAWTTLLPWRTATACSGVRFDHRRLIVRLDALRHQLVWLRGFSAALFTIVMVALPVLVISERFSSSAHLLLPAFAVSWAGTLAAFFVAYPHVHGSRPPFDVWLTMTLSPVSLIRAPHAVCLPVAASSHPVAMAAALCGDEEFLAIARVWHFDAPRLRKAIEILARRRGVEARLLAPPALIEPGVTRFCRRCHATFKDTATACADCDGVELTALAG